MEQLRFIDDVEALLRRALEAEPPLVASDTRLLLEAARHLCLAGGAKRARPWLVQAFGEAVGAAEEDDLVNVAVAAELIHGASLLHDDVVDEGTMRRGRPTVNRVWGNTVAVLSGDLLLSIAFDHIKRLPPAILHDALDVVLEMTRAAITEVCQRGRPDVPLSRWRAVAEGKTGSLFAWCGRAAAHIADDDEAVEMLDACGRHLGVAFQLADDLKDLTPADSGKDRLADIRSRNPSYPLLLACAEDDELRARLAEVWRDGVVGENEVEEIGERVLRTGALEETRKVFVEELTGAVDALGAYVLTTGGEKVVGWAQALAEAAGAGATPFELMERLEREAVG